MPTYSTPIMSFIIASSLAEELCKPKIAAASLVARWPQTVWSGALPKHKDMPEPAWIFKIVV